MRDKVRYWAWAADGQGIAYAWGAESYVYDLRFGMVGVAEKYLSFLKRIRKEIF